MFVAALSAAAVSTALAQDKAKVAPKPMDNPRVAMETTLGTIVLELDANKAPISTDNFLKYAESGFYNGTIFHRVMSNFMIQGGGFTADMDKKTEGMRPMVKNEWRNGLSNQRGTIAMARLGGKPHSASSQFFINVVNNKGLDQPRDGAAYAVFGKVVEGMDVVDKIRNTKVIKHPKYPAGSPVTPEVPVVIKSVKLIGTCDQKALDQRCKVSAQKIAKYDANPLLDQEKLVDEIIKKAEADSGNKVQKSASGLRWVTLKDGDGATPSPTDRVEVHYTGWLTNGSKFDSSVDRNKPFTFSLSGGVIRGWLEGVATMKVGEKRKLIIPPNLGYGKRGSPPRIPANSILVFDVELLAIK